MTTSTEAKPVRDGNAAKRAAILTAARELFVRDGFERTSMDAIAAQAGVSKRTVYDYYGDKRRLLLGVIEAAGESILVSLHQAVGEHLSDTADIRDAESLERSLAAFATQVGVSMLATIDYAATVRLIVQNAAQLPELEGHPLEYANEEAIAERLAHFAEVGLLDIDDPRLAADHFNALTTLLAVNDRYATQLDADHIRRVMVDGVHAFMRAYARR